MPARMHGVSASLNQGVLPRQQKHIKQVIKILANQQSRSDLEVINDKLTQECKLTNQIRSSNVEMNRSNSVKKSTVANLNQFIKDKTPASKKSHEKPKSALLTPNEVKRPDTSNFTDKSSYNPIGDGLQQARYEHNQLSS